MIVILTVGIFLILLIAAIVVICCLRSRRAKGAISSGPSFLRFYFQHPLLCKVPFNAKFIIAIRYRGPGVPGTGTLDRTAIIRGDVSSESSGTDNYGVGASI